MQGVEILKQRIEDLEKDILAINGSNEELKMSYTKAFQNLQNLIEENDISEKEYHRRLQYSLFEIHEHDFYKLQDKLREYSTNFFINEYKDKEIDFEDFLKKTSSNYYCLLNPNPAYKNYNREGKDFRVKNYACKKEADILLESNITEKDFENIENLKEYKKLTVNRTGQHWTLSHSNIF